MFGHASLPSCIYEYDVIERKTNTSNEEDYLDKQLLLKIQFRNFLAAKTKRNSEVIHQTKREIFPDYAKLENDINSLTEHIDEIYTQIRNQKQKERSKFSGTPEQKTKIKQLKAKRKLLYDGRKAKN